MAKTSDWFWTWIPRLIDRLPRADWPAPGSEYWDGMLAIFGKHRVTEDTADAATLAMMESPSPFPDQFIAAFLVQVKAARTLASGLDPTSFEAASVASSTLRNGLGCEYCDNGGQLCVYHPLPATRRGRPDRVAAHCVCPAGRWLRSRLMAGDAATCRKVVDLADVLSGAAPWQIFPPGIAEWEDRIPAAGGGMALLRSFVKSQKAAMTAARQEQRDVPITTAEVAFAQSLPAAEKDRFYALPARDRRIVMLGAEDSILRARADALMGREAAAVEAEALPPTEDGPAF